MFLLPSLHASGTRIIIIQHIMASTSRTRDEDLSHVEFETSEEVEVIPTFDKMNLREELLRGIYAYGMYCNNSI